MECVLMNACYSIYATFFQAGFQSRQSFARGRDSVAGFADCDQCFARDGTQSGKAFSNLSSGSQSGDGGVLCRLHRFC